MWDRLLKMTIFRKTLHRPPKSVNSNKSHVCDLKTMQKQERFFTKLKQI
jgi:hypothetical protein